MHHITYHTHFIGGARSLSELPKDGDPYFVCTEFRFGI